MKSGGPECEGDAQAPAAQVFRGHRVAKTEGGPGWAVRGTAHPPRPALSMPTLGPPVTLTFSSVIPLVLKEKTRFLYIVLSLPTHRSEQESGRGGWSSRKGEGPPVCACRPGQQRAAIKVSVALGHPISVP